MLQRLKEKGCRITKQRKILIDIILQGECTSCKEIYYKAAERICIVFPVGWIVTGKMYDPVIGQYVLDNWDEVINVVQSGAQ